MSTPFVQQLRVRGGAIELAREAGEALRLRVQVPEVWDAVRVIASPDDPVQLVKVHALQRLQSGALAHDQYVVKFRGWEILDESASLRDVGARDGSIFLITFRRRRPVR